MNAARMRKIAAMYPKNSVTQIAKTMLTFEGNKTVDYSFKENLQICRRAVIRAIRWKKNRPVKKSVWWNNK